MFWGVMRHQAWATNRPDCLGPSSRPRIVSPDLPSARQLGRTTAMFLPSMSSKRPKLRMVFY